jgi:hypothetical protein
LWFVHSTVLNNWEELAPFVKKQALTATKRARVQNDLPRTRILPKSIVVLGACLIYFKESKYNWWKLLSSLSVEPPYVIQNFK